MGNRDLILITRPIDEAKEFAAGVGALGCETLIAPMLVIEPVEFLVPDLTLYRGLIFTSANGVRAFAARVKSRDHAAYCVGDDTAKLATDLGFAPVFSAGGDAGDLAALVKEKAGDKRLLHVRGRDARVSFKNESAAVDELVAYAAMPVNYLSPACIHAIREGDIIAAAFFSARTAANFIKLVEMNKLTGHLAAIKFLSISDAVVQSLPAYGWQETYIAESPDRAGMLKLIEQIKSIDTKGTDTMIQNEASIHNAGAIIERFGGIRPMASKISVPVTTVQGWKKRGSIPVTRLEQIQQAARDHNVDISDILSASVANENARAAETQTSVPPSGNKFAEEMKKAKGDKATESVLAAALPADAYQDIARQLSKAERKAIAKSTAINILFLLVTVGAVVLLMWPQTRLGQNQNGERLQQLEQNVAQLQGSVDKVEKTVPSDLDQKLAALSAQAATAATQAVGAAQSVSQGVFGPEDGTVQERLSKLETNVANISGSPIIAGVVEKIQLLQSSAAGQEQISRAWAQLSGMATSNPAGLESELAAAKDTNPDLAQVLGGASGGDLRDAAMVFGMEQLKGALGLDNTPFAQDIQVVKAIIGPNYPEVSAALDMVAPQAQQGITTPPTLASEFTGLAGDIVGASLTGKNVSIGELATARINNFIQIQKGGELISGTPTQAAVSKTQHLLGEGDLPGAIASAQTLSGPAADIAAPWITKAQVTLTAQQLKNTLSRTIGAKAYGRAGVTTMDASLLGTGNLYKH